MRCLPESGCVLITRLHHPTASSGRITGTPVFTPRHLPAVAIAHRAPGYWIRFGWVNGLGFGRVEETVFRALELQHRV